MKIAIIGGGISGLSLAYFIKRSNRPFEISVYESENRTGGKINTVQEGGYLFETGVNGYLDNRPRTLELVNMLGLTPLRSSDLARKRFILSKGILQQLPESPPAFFKSNLLSVKGRMRIVYEYMAKKEGVGDETLEAFAVRRLGREAFEKLIEPMALGIYAGDATRLSLPSCFPKIRRLEENYGSLIKGMMKMRRSGVKTGAGPGGILTSFHYGMESLITALRDTLKDEIFTGREAVSIERGYKITFRDGNTTDADIVVIASPAYAASRMLYGLDGGIGKELLKIPYPPLAVICLGYKKSSISHDLNGFGYLVPSVEGRGILGTLFDSSIFPNRAPEGHALLRVMIGGARRPELCDMDDDRMVVAALSELRETLTLWSDPDIVRIFRHNLAIPQYNIGHMEILKRLDESLKTHNGLYLHGNAYRGIGVNDCIENSILLAEKITTTLSKY